MEIMRLIVWGLLISLPAVTPNNSSEDHIKIMSEMIGLLIWKSLAELLFLSKTVDKMYIGEYLRPIGTYVEIGIC